MFWDFLFPRDQTFEVDFYCVLDCKIKLLCIAHNKKKFAKHYICRSQIEIEKGPTTKKNHWVKKYESINWI